MHKVTEDMCLFTLLELCKYIRILVPLSIITQNMLRFQLWAEDFQECEGIEYWIIICTTCFLLIVSFLLLFSEEAVVGNSEAVEILKDYYIPDYILLPDLEIEQQACVPECPLIVFINTKSGGQLGGELLLTCCSLLNKNQVCF